MIAQLYSRVRLKHWRFQSWSKSIGLGHTLLYLIRRALGYADIIKLRPSSSLLLARSETSDIHVYRQVFIDEEYRDVVHPEAELVLDCGADVGYSAAYFLSRMPRSFVVAIEPDRSNFELLRENTKNYQDRCQYYHAGIWTSDSPLRIAPNNYRDGDQWALQVEECTENEASFHGLGIDSILRKSDFDRISLLKMDIEGAEALIFKEKPDWLALTDMIAIELHDDSSFGPATEHFFKAIEDEDFEISKSGDLTICRRRQPM